MPTANPNPVPTISSLQQVINAVGGDPTVALTLVGLAISGLQANPAGLQPLLVRVGAWSRLRPATQGYILSNPSDEVKLLSEELALVQEHQAFLATFFAAPAPAPTPAA
jgi:hypothetical protein